MAGVGKGERRKIGERAGAGQSVVLVLLIIFVDN